MFPRSVSHERGGGVVSGKFPSQGVPIRFCRGDSEAWGTPQSCPHLRVQNWNLSFPHESGGSHKLGLGQSAEEEP